MPPVLLEEKELISCFSVSALMLSLTIRLYRKYHTLDIDRITYLMKGEDD